MLGYAVDGKSRISSIDTDSCCYEKVAAANLSACECIVVRCAAPHKALQMQGYIIATSTSWIFLKTISNMKHFQWIRRFHFLSIFNASVTLTETQHYYISV